MYRLLNTIAIFLIKNMISNLIFPNIKRKEKRMCYKISYSNLREENTSFLPQYYQSCYGFSLCFLIHGRFLPQYYYLLVHVRNNNHACKSSMSSKSHKYSSPLFLLSYIKILKRTENSNDQEILQTKMTILDYITTSFFHPKY
jgi:hypothetical protein